MPEVASDVTGLLDAWSSGDIGAFKELVPLIHDDLRAMAHRQMAHEPADHTLQATAVVNELYLKLAGRRSVHWQSRSQFFATISQLIRRILVDHARRRASRRRGGHTMYLTLDRALGWPATVGGGIDLIALDQALDRLEAMDRRQARIVEMRFFAGMTLAETAGHLKVSTMTVKRDWRSARLWLLSELNV